MARVLCVSRNIDDDGVAEWTTPSRKNVATCVVKCAVSGLQETLCVHDRSDPRFLPINVSIHWSGLWAPVNNNTCVDRGNNG